MHSRIILRAIVAGPFAMLWMAAGAHADVTISSGTTQNMSCTAGVCVPTSPTAVLNTGDLQTMLAAGSVSISTTNTGVQANNIDVAAPFSWKTAGVLTLDAFQSITVTGVVSDEGDGGVSLLTNDGGSGGNLLFLAGGSIGFTNLRDALIINGTRYKLAGTLKDLIYDIVDFPSHAFALANDLNERSHGIYRSSPIPVQFGGSLTGLGHVISNLEIGDAFDENVGFFTFISAPAYVSGIGFENIRVDGPQGEVGALAGESLGTVVNAWASGRINGVSACGGLVGDNGGAISNAWSSADVVCGSEGMAGGLVGTNSDVIEASFATGTVESRIGHSGGLAGSSPAVIENSYATGRIEGSGSVVGGLAGEAGAGGAGAISSSYSTGHVVRGGGAIGGFLGDNLGLETTDCYWDTSTNNGLKGVGIGGETGITGLTTQQLESGLPSGFDPTIWAESPSINNGFPYLIANPPP
jgi:hypothetical protein